jgi:CelD/BcsL family acetyltransferase involved in cellulose biosynthesis
MLDGGSATVECLDDQAEIAELTPEWESLSDAQVPWLPFLGPIWNRVWWRHMAERGPLVTDLLEVRAIRSQAGALIAVAPLMVTERPAMGPLRARLLQFLGADPLMTEARGMACHSEHQAAAYAALLHHLRHERRLDWDFMRWSGIPADGAGRMTLGTSPVELAESPSAFVLDLPSSWPDLKSRLPRNIKESLRKCYNSLKREGLTFEFRVLEGGSGAVEGLSQFFLLHGLRARRSRTVGHNDVFSSVKSRAFLRDYFAESRPGSALIFQLLIRGEVVATRIGFRARGSLYLYYSGYEPAWGRYSVMTTLVAEMLKWAVAHGITVANLSFGQDVSKTRWRPREIAFHQGQWASPSIRGRLLRHAFTGLDGLRNHARLGAATRNVLHLFGARTAAAPSVAPPAMRPR